MDNKHRFATKDPASGEKKQGIVICGLNWGGKDVTPSYEHCDIFTDNRPGDHFVQRLMLWFEWWNIPLMDGKTPTEVNRKISQTNLFDDWGMKFDWNSKTDSEIRREFKNLIERCKDKQAIVVMLCSIEAGRRFASFLSSEWVNCTECKGGVASESKREYRFQLRYMNLDSMLFVNMPHPRYPLHREVVEPYGEQVRKWLAPWINA